MILRLPEHSQHPITIERWTQDTKASIQQVTLLLIGYIQFSNDLGAIYMERDGPLDFQPGFKREDPGEKTTCGPARFAQSGKVFAFEEDCLVSLIFFTKRK